MTAHYCFSLSLNFFFLSPYYTLLRTISNNLFKINMLSLFITLGIHFGKFKCGFQKLCA